MPRTPEWVQAGGYSRPAFWGEEPPKPEVQASAMAARRKGLAGSGPGLNFFLIGIGALLVVGLIVGLTLAARGSRPRGKRIPVNRPCP